MTKEEIVKWLKSLKKEIGKAENHALWHYAESIDMAIRALSEPKTGWIPVIEKLPDKEKLVLVTDNDSIEFGKLICGLFGDLWLIWVGDCWTEAMKVTAWIPLPEPYKGETNGKM